MLKMIFILLLFYNMCACSVFSIHDTSKDTVLTKKADSIMAETDSLINDLDSNMFIILPDTSK